MALTGLPDLVENDAVRHDEALAYLLHDTDAAHPLAVATGYVNLDGLLLLARELGDVRSARLLLGAAPAPGLGAEVPALSFEQQLDALAGERDFARFPPSRAARRLAEVDAFLARPDVDVRRFVTRFLHGKAYLFGTEANARAALVTSANLTGPGMRSNLELGLVQYGPAAPGRALAWFDGLWDAATPYTDELRALLFPALPAVTPEDVYLRALLELYGDELYADDGIEPATSRLELAAFQRDGYRRARQILARHHGVVYADGVGTGKTTVGLALIEEYALRQGRHALVVAPAQLRDMWEREIARARLPAQVVSYQQLARDEQLADAGRASGRELRVSKDSYRLVLVDEAHALRNADNTWYRAMTRLLGGERKDVVLLSATPVNNSLWDLFNLVMLFVRHDRGLVDVGIDSIRQLFLSAGARERDVESLNPDRLFPLADAVSVRRDRRFLVENYPDATFPDGTPVRFPTPQLSCRRYELERAAPGLVGRVAAGIGALSMARYRPSAYEVGERPRGSENALAGLLQSAVLKRFESSWAACLATIERMVSAHERFLDAWDAGLVLAPEVLRYVAGIEDGGDSAAWLAEVREDEGTRSTDDFRPEYRDAVDADHGELRSVAATLAQLSAEDDPKLALLADVLGQQPGKVAVFATYSETISYLDEHLDAVLTDGRERVVVLGPETTPDERLGLLARFTPDTVVEPGYHPPDGEVDLLLSTDVVSEGQNLQQAGCVVSYDMPWNPQRVVQRNGRVIRLRSPHDTVQLVTMLPVRGELESLLRLESRLQAKIAAAGVFGMESGVLDDDDVSAQRHYADLDELAERLDEGDESLLEEADDAAGSFAGEQLRRLLQRAKAEGEVARLEGLPWGVGTSFRQAPSVPSVGSSGVFFAFRTRGEPQQRYWRYVQDDGTLDRDELPILRRISPGSAPAVDHAGDLEAAWRVAVADVVAEHNVRADPAQLEQRLPPSQRFALALLRDPDVALPPGAEEADELLAVPRDSAVRRGLTDLQRQVEARSLSRDQAANAVVGVVREYGLTPVPPPPVLPVIDEDDVGVVCWMRVLPPEGA